MNQTDTCFFVKSVKNIFLGATAFWKLVYMRHEIKRIENRWHRPLCKADYSRLQCPGPLPGTYSSAAWLYLKHETKTALKKHDNLRAFIAI